MTGAWFLKERQARNRTAFIRLEWRAHQPAMLPTQSPTDHLSAGHGDTSRMSALPRSSLHSVGLDSRCKLAHDRNLKITNGNTTDRTDCTQNNVENFLSLEQKDDHE